MIAAPPPIQFSHMQSIRDVQYWLKTGDWPLEGGLREQATKVKTIAKILVGAMHSAERNQYMRIELLKIAFSG